MERSGTSKTRQINTFRKPFDPTDTPYKADDIKVEVSRFCRNACGDVGAVEKGKIIFIGDSGVGKTSLIRRFCKNKFNSQSLKTARDVENERFDIFGVPFFIDIWDTAGHERFKWIRNSYYRGINAIVIVFDLTEMNTLCTCSDWLSEANYENNHDYVFLVGNKLDAMSEQDYALTKGAIHHFSAKINAEYWPVSSKTGKNVKKFFLRAAMLTFESVVMKGIGEKGDSKGLPTRKIRLQNTSELNEASNCEF